MKDYSLELKDLENDLKSLSLYASNFNISQQKREQLQVAQYLINRLRKEVLKEDISSYIELLESDVIVREDTVLSKLKEEIKERFKKNLEEYKDLNLELASQNGHIFHLIKELLLDIDNINLLVGHYKKVKELQTDLNKYLNDEGEYPFDLLSSMTLEEDKSPEEYEKQLKEALAKSIFHLKEYKKRQELWFGE